jgi:hypothetical protein
MIMMMMMMIIIIIIIIIIIAEAHNWNLSQGVSVNKSTARSFSLPSEPDF